MLVLEEYGVRSAGGHEIRATAWNRPASRVRWRWHRRTVDGRAVRRPGCADSRALAGKLLKTVVVTRSTVVMVTHDVIEAALL